MNPLNKNVGKAQKSIPGRVNAKRVDAEFNGVMCHFRSTAEYRYAVQLDMKRKAGLISDWKYEPRFFEFEEIKHGTTRYKPDFLIIHMDGSEEYIEIKGRVVPTDKTKMNRMAKYYPEVKITMLDSKKFQPMKP